MYPKKIPSYPSNKMVLLEIGRQLESAYKKVKARQKHCLYFPISIGTCTIIKMKFIFNLFMKWEQCPLEEYSSIRLMFDPLRYFTKLEGKDYIHKPYIENHYINCVDDYGIIIKKNPYELRIGRSGSKVRDLCKRMGQGF